MRDNDDAGSGQVLLGTTSVEDGASHHVALERDVGAGKLRLYVDGAKELEDTRQWDHATCTGRSAG